MIQPWNTFISSFVETLEERCKERDENVYVQHEIQNDKCFVAIHSDQTINGIERYVLFENNFRQMDWGEMR